MTMTNAELILDPVQSPIADPHKVLRGKCTAEPPPDKQVAPKPRRMTGSTFSSTNKYGLAWMAHGLKKAFRYHPSYDILSPPVGPSTIPVRSQHPACQINQEIDPRPCDTSKEGLRIALIASRLVSEYLSETAGCRPAEDVPCQHRHPRKQETHPTPSPDVTLPHRQVRSHRRCQCSVGYGYTIHAFIVMSFTVPQRILRLMERLIIYKHLVKFQMVPCKDVLGGEERTFANK